MDSNATAGQSSSGAAPNLDEEMSEGEKKLALEIDQLKEKLKSARKNIADTDFFKMTEHLQELGRLKFKIRKHLRGHLTKVTSLQWASDSQLMVSAAQDGNLIVWDTHTTNKLYMIGLETAWVMACAFSPKMNQVISGGLDNLISLFSLSPQDGPTAKLTKHLQGHDGYVACLRYVDNNRILSCSGDKSCALWDVERSMITSKFLGHANDVTALALPKDKGDTFISVSSDKTCRVWDMRTNMCMQYFDGHEQDVNGVEFFPKSQYGFVTSSDDGSCRLWDLRADQAIAVYIDDFIQCGSTSVALSKSGRLLIAGYDDFNCHVWDVLREERVGIMSAHDGRVSCVAVCDSGVGIATGSWDSTCLIWTGKS